MPREQIEKKVADYLRDSQALEDYWQSRSLLSNSKPR